MISDEDLARMELQSRSDRLDAEEAKSYGIRNEMMMQEQDKGIASEQLDVSAILNNMYYLLKGYVLVRNPSTKEMEWNEPKDNDMIILSDYGVNYILGAVQWYINKNTLLSNYEDDKAINTKMEDFATTLTDNIFMDYDKMFAYPTLDDCKKEIERRIQSKVDIKVFTNKILGLPSDAQAIRDSLVKEMESRIVREMEVIKQQKLKSKLKRFESLIRFVQDAVHSAYNRAWKGQERRTLREHIQITESKGGLAMLGNQQRFTMNPMKAFGGK